MSPAPEVRVFFSPEGDVISRVIAIEAGANFNGNCKMGDTGNINVSAPSTKPEDTVKK